MQSAPIGLKRSLWISWWDGTTKILVLDELSVYARGKRFEIELRIKVIPYPEGVGELDLGNQASRSAKGVSSMRRSECEADEAFAG